MKPAKIALALLLAMGLAGSASATDLFVSDDTMYTAPADDGFDWGGFYAGVLGGAYWEISNPEATISKVVGFNGVSGNFVFGAEVELLHDVGCCEAVAVRGRVGVLATDRVLIYGAAGYYDWLTGSDAPTASAGVEVAFGDNLVGRAEFMTLFYGGSAYGYLPRAGLIWNFD